MNIADLPTDIKHFIANCMTDGFDKSLDGFSTALPVLWICREWRLLAQDRIYSCAYLNVNTSKTAESQLPLLHKVDTNYALICRNKLQHLVTNLYIEHSSMVEGTDITAVVNRIIKVIISGSTPMIRINYYTTDSLARHIATLFNGNSDAINNGIGAVLVRTFHNVKGINIHTNEFLLKLPLQINDIVAAYSKQLSSVKFYGNNVRLNLTPASNLTNLDLDVRIGSNNSSIPLITLTSPLYLQNFKLETSRSAHLCELFCWSPDTNMIYFNNLNRLELSSDEDNYIDVIDENRDIESNANACTHELAFPALADLYLENYSVYSAELKYLLQAPLRRLTFVGLASQFFQFYDKLPSTLEYLSIDFYLREHNENLANDLNKILPCTQGINTVALEVCFSEIKVDITNINWPNLTHIDLASDNRFTDMLDIAEKAPDLRMFKFCLLQQHLDEIDQTIEFLLNIKEHYSRPSSYKIHTLTIYYCITSINVTFNEALENLKWYWPNLQYIIFE